MRNAGLVKRLTTRRKAQALVKTFGAALGVQHDFRIAPAFGSLDQGMKDFLPDM